MAVIEGRNAVLESMRAGMPLREIMIADGVRRDASLDEIERLAKQAKVMVRHVKRREIDQRSERGTHQGVLAEADAFRFTPMAEALASSRGNPWSVVVVLDHVTDPGNLGAIARSAEVAGADALIVPRHRSAAITAGAWKTSAGALSYLPVVQEANVARAIRALKEADYWVAGASEKADASLWGAALEGRIALVMGAEGAGLSRLAREECDFLVSIPQRGNVGSLNVGQAATVLLYEWSRRREAKG